MGRNTPDTPSGQGSEEHLTHARDVGSDADILAAAKSGSRPLGLFSKNTPAPDGADGSAIEWKFAIDGPIHPFEKGGSGGGVLEIATRYSSTE